MFPCLPVPDSLWNVLSYISFDELKQPAQNYEDGGDEGSGDGGGEDFEYVEAEGGCVAACQDILGWDSLGFRAGKI